jgi:folate-dependent tRNA-U54 methylase TrmFO/GidA
MRLAHGPVKPVGLLAGRRKKAASKKDAALIQVRCLKSFFKDSGTPGQRSVS